MKSYELKTVGKVRKKYGLRLVVIISVRIVGYLLFQCK